jgi:hypothetical protein
VLCGMASPVRALCVALHINKRREGPVTCGKSGLGVYGLASPYTVQVQLQLLL